MRIENDVIEILENVQTEGPRLVITGHLDRKMYVRVNKALEAAGGKWSRKDTAHIFDSDASVRIDEMILTGSVECPKNDFNFFPTPPEIVAQLLDLAEIENGMTVLEPSAGTGAIAFAIADTTDIFPDCFEIAEKNFNVLASDTRLGEIYHLDFLEALSGNVRLYDRIVMNPPFAKQADIRHVKHALTFLKADGILVSVMSAGVTFRENRLTQDFRDMLDSCSLGETYNLPDGAFKESGTMVRSVIVRIGA